jgi:predicted nucleotidyltransferase
MQKGHYLGFDEKSSLEKHLKSRLNKKIDLVSLKYMNPAIRVKAELDIVYV